MSECSQDCSSCGESCSDRFTKKEDFKAVPNQLSKVKKVIGVVSGKGGVGKSLVTALLASSMQKQGYRSAVLDADITGPSIPKIFGVKNEVKARKEGLVPPKSPGGCDIMSINLLLQEETQPVIWRGVIIANTVKQFWTDVIWSDIDIMFIDMPPGTGDVPLTVFQSLPVDGIIVVTSPQELVSMIVEKAVNMAKMMDIPIIGLIENMSYFECPDCGKKIQIFGESHIEDIASKCGLKVLGKIPMDTSIAEKCDEGRVEELTAVWLEDAINELKKLPAL